jgi:hypothetical protein
MAALPGGGISTCCWVCCCLKAAAKALSASMLIWEYPAAGAAAAGGAALSAGSAAVAAAAVSDGRDLGLLPPSQLGPRRPMCVCSLILLAALLPMMSSKLLSEVLKSMLLYDALYPGMHAPSS